MLFSLVGCKKDPPPVDPPGPDVPGGDPGEDPGPHDPPKIETPGDISANAPVTPVPPEAVSALTYAVIRQGDLWLGIDSTRLWRQTDSGDVDQIVWAPDGHALAFFSNPSLENYTRALYTLIPGSRPVLIEADAIAYDSWPNSRGFLWSPDSTQLAYGTENGSEISIVGPGATKGGFTRETPDLFESGPYWLAPDRLLLSIVSPVPLLVITNTLGTEINTLLDAALPYPIAGGLLAAGGEYAEYEEFYFNSLIYADDDGQNLTRIYQGRIFMCLLAWNPKEAERIEESKYFALSDGESLFLQKYKGLAGADPQQVELLTQDLFLSFSEFSYPFWFAWAPGGDTLAVLRFTFTREGDYGEQEGFWDLVQVDRKGNRQIILPQVYTVKGEESPLPFLTLPFCWHPQGSQIFYLQQGKAETDLWSMDLAGGKSGIWLVNSELPVFIP